MNAFSLAFLWSILFIGCMFTIEGLNYLFWLCFVGFCLCCLYAEVNKKRLLKEIADIEIFLETIYKHNF